MMPHYATTFHLATSLHATIPAAATNNTEDSMDLSILRDGDRGPRDIGVAIVRLRVVDL